MIGRVIAVLVLPLMLASCVLTPGKFESTLTVNADRNFAFTYVGEVVAIEADDSVRDLSDLKPADDAPDQSDARPVDGAAKKAVANEGSRPIPGLPGGAALPDPAARLDGVFTLDTNAEIVSQNEEAGVQLVANRKRIVWKATPALKQAPTAVLKLATLAP